MLHKLLAELAPGDDTRGIVHIDRNLAFIDRNLAFVLQQLPDARLREKLKAVLDLAPIDMLSCKKVFYDVLVGIHRGGPTQRFSHDVRLLCNRCAPYDLALGMLNEVMGLASQGTSTSFATVFNLASISTFLMSYSARVIAQESDTSAARNSNVVAESYMLHVLPNVLPKLENQRQALLVARCLYVV